jgi:hypothetical protein
VERVPARAGARNGGVRFLQCATRRRVKGDEVRARTSLRAGWDAGPGLMQRLGEAGGSRGAGLRTKRWEQPRQRDGRAVLPDARARASTTERQSESEPVVEAPSFAEQPQSWRTSAVCSNDRALEDGRSLQARAGLVAGGDAAIALRMRCRGRAGCRPGQTEHGERGKRPERAEPLVARQGPMPAAALGAWPSPRSSPRTGKPSTWRRRTAGLQHRKPFRRSDVNTSAPSSAHAEERVLGWQRKLHRWATSACPVESPVRGNSHAGFGGRRRADRLA